jgi:thymidylate kinase
VTSAAGHAARGRDAGRHEALAAGLAATVDRAADERVLVIGSLPPDGRDLELVVRTSAERRIADALTEAGLARRGLEWAKFSDSSVYAIELIPADRLGLRREELEALFAEAKPIGTSPNEFRHLARPAPHHLLLLQARRLIRDGKLAEKRRPRIAAALDEDPQARVVAAERAADWGLRRGLVLLERSVESNSPPTRWERIAALWELVRAAPTLRQRVELVRRSARAKLPRRARVVAISGLDGSGKSGQARALQETLTRLVVPAVVEWLPLGQNRALKRVRLLMRPLKASTSEAPVLAEGLPPYAFDSRAPDAARRLRQRSALATHLWATMIVLSNIVFHRRATFRQRFSGNVVIFDRYTCDSAVQLRFWYGEDRQFRFQRWLLRALSPRPFRAFFLEIPAEIALIRKGEYTLDELRIQESLYRDENAIVRAERIDGERPPAELCAAIAAAVWSSLPAP